MTYLLGMLLVQTNTPTIERICVLNTGSVSRNVGHQTLSLTKQDSKQMHFISYAVDYLKNGIISLIQWEDSPL